MVPYTAVVLVDTCYNQTARTAQVMRMYKIYIYFPHLFWIHILLILYFKHVDYIMYIVTKIELDLEIWIQGLNGNTSNKVMFI